jgi:hypothetical protein
MARKKRGSEDDIGSMSKNDLGVVIQKVIGRPLTVAETKRFNELEISISQTAPLVMGEVRHLDDDPEDRNKESYILPRNLHPRTRSLFSQISHQVTILSEPKFSSKVLREVVTPTIAAIESFQRLCDKIIGQESSDIRLHYIASHSPVIINFDGIGDVIRALNDEIIPYRRRHAKEMAQLQEGVLKVELLKGQAAVKQALTISDKESAESSKLKAETIKILAEAEGQMIENEERRFKLNEQKLDMALRIVDAMQSDLKATERLTHAVQLLPLLDTLSDHHLEVRAEPAE